MAAPAPAPTPPHRVTATVLRPVGTPVPLGFLALAGAAFVTAGLQLGWTPPAERAAAGTVMIAFAFPLQLLASVLGFRARDTAFGTAMAVLAGSWLVQGVVLSAGPLPGTRHALGLFLLVTAASLLVPIAAADTGKIAATVVIACASLRLGATGLHELTRAPEWETASGVIGLVLTAAALYAAAAFALEDTRHRPVLPVGRPGSRSTAVRQRTEPGERPEL
ncbi:hypothetical protein ABZ924_19580 [Streptomyces sp. NPDC046876]|uniref:hypothetical protein n=1 Tax=Streptomyces sp. NPDC046876 TaxID=3155616 RepID=UPI00340B43CD